MKKFLVVLLSLFPLISCTEIKYNVTLIGEHCHFEEGKTTATRGHDYSVKVIFDRGYDLLGGDITVTVKDLNIPTGYYHYDNNTEMITVKGEVITNDMKIEAHADIKESIFTITVGEGYVPFSVDSPKSKSISINIDLDRISIDVVPLNGKNVNPNITVTSSDGPISASKYSFTKHEEDDSYTFLMDDHREFYHDINVVVPNAI